MKRRAGMQKKASHMEGLRYKLSRELPPEVLEDCEDYPALQHRKRMVYALRHAYKKASRHTQRYRALREEERLA